MTFRIISRVATILCLMTGMSTSHVQAENTVVSPGKKFSIHFSVKDTAKIQGALFWRVDYNGKTLMAESQLGFTLLNAPSMDAEFKITRVKHSKHDSIWKTVYGEQSEIRDNYSQMQVTVEDNQSPPRHLLLTFRAYDEGVAMRTTFPVQKAFSTLTIKSEETRFRFNEDLLTWTTRNAQGSYKKLHLSEMNLKHNYERPLFMKNSEGLHLVILEAGMLDYSRMRLGRDASVPNTIISRLGGTVSLKTPYSTPWRVLMVAATPGEILESNYLTLNLSPPNRLADTSWIKPGKQCREYSITTKNSKAMIDFLAKVGLEYLELDTGWYGPESDEAADASTVTRAAYFEKHYPGSFDLPEIIRYAKSKGIGVVLYVNRIHLEKQLDELLPLYQKWGIAGLKFGFVRVGDQDATKWMHDAIRKCGEHHLFVDIHDEYRPTGIERTYPNFMTSEGIKGNEGAGPTPKQDVENTFIRCLCGPADFTMAWHQKRVKLSWSHQMAAAIVYYSPLQTLFWSDPASMFTGDEPYMKFFGALPTVWNQKRVIHGEIGEYITVARRSDDAWFVGTMNAMKRRKVDIPLSFLTPGIKYTATIYYDTDPEGATESKSLKIKTMDVTSETVIHADMADNGGQAIHITPVAKP